MESSSFDELINCKSFDFSEIQKLYSNGNTSNTYKIYLEGKWYFLKRPKDEYSNHPLYKAAFEKEFEIGSKIEHPNISSYLEKGYDSNGIYLLAPYIEGYTLKEFLEKEPDYFHSKSNLKKFIQQLLSALEYLHERQTLHLDLKPDNILITKIDHDVKIVDLGFAYTDSHQYETSGKSERYAAPEQVDNCKNVDQQADIYSFGLLVLYAYTSSDNKSLLNKLPKPYKNCISKCLEENKDDRFKDILSIQDYLTHRYKLKRRLTWAIVILSILVIIGAMQFLFYKDRAPLDISNMDVPEDIMQRLSINTSVDYIKEQYGEPKDIYELDSMFAFYTWTFKNMELTTLVKNNNSIEKINYRLTDKANLLYDDMLSGCEIPNLGKATFGDFFDGYNFDGNFISWGGDFCVDLCFCQVETDQITIVLGPNRPTNYMLIKLYSTKVDLLELNDELIARLYHNGVGILTKAEKQYIFEKVKKIKIEGISYSYKEFGFPLTPFRID
ncbi:protein kinase [Dysgonomonas sp. 511]|uniref:protein kinase domain-containing protein n=1 Tax=Dysgonomonas sp. 511 TaxID=2302930 RepID=UPI0013D3DB09|nr:protein kinase [Dysgonomonas sp. 511]NDV78754.1 hypothetical protein [Dysgonomonas sp. 511]